jgi:2-oxoglutarate ferredoxin oxidoreductase subunit delta
MSSKEVKKKKKEGYIVIIEERCKTCTFCIETCPNDCIVVGTKLNAAGYHPVEFVGKGKCTACCMCAEVCPDTAIEVFK